MTGKISFSNHEAYMHRCLELAKQGAGYVVPNPMVGAVLVHEGRIIGEGWHKNFGGPHAEVNCLNSVSDEDRNKIAASVLYVSLEPCAHFGKTPPCADLIIKYKIPQVVIGCRDPFKEVNGRGIEKLKAAGVKVAEPVLENQCIELNKRFFTFHTRRRPYIILKWAESADGKIAGVNGARQFISNELSNRIVHKWRSEETSILVGTNTALLDNPALTTRNWTGLSPLRLVVDMDLKLPSSLKIFNDSRRTVIFNKLKQGEEGPLQYILVKPDMSLVHQIIDALYQMNIQSVMVEGGAKLIQSFINVKMWDEIRIIKNEELRINNGIEAPVINEKVWQKELMMKGDRIKFITKNNLT